MTEDKKFKRLVRARAARTGESYSTSLQHLRARKTEDTSMTTETDRTDFVTLNCSFCGKGQKDVKKLIAGPAEVCICDECVELCTDIISEEVEEAAPSEEQLAAAWTAMLKNRALTLRSAEQNLQKIVRQARAKGVDWTHIGASLGMTAEEAERRFGSEQ